MVYNTEEIVKRANASKKNAVGTCQLWTRTIIGVDSAGDRDRDGDADAVDGWKSEPMWARHTGDRNPPAGMPVAFSGGSKGYGHRAVSLGQGRIRSTDMSATGWSPGNVGTTTIAQIERSMGVTYTGWSETMTGVKIPQPEKTRGEKVDEALEALEDSHSKKDSERRRLIDRAKALLSKIKLRTKR
jgi:hypothetical protein